MLRLIKIVEECKQCLTNQIPNLLIQMAKRTKERIDSKWVVCIFHHLQAINLRLLYTLLYVHGMYVIRPNQLSHNQKLHNCSHEHYQPAATSSSNLAHTVSDGSCSKTARMSPREWPVIPWNYMHRYFHYYSHKYKRMYCILVRRSVGISHSPTPVHSLRILLQLCNAHLPALCDPPWTVRRPADLTNHYPVSSGLWFTSSHSSTYFRQMHRNRIHSRTIWPIVTRALSDLPAAWQRPARP